MRTIVPIVLMLWMSTAQAAHKIEQTIEGKREGQSYHANHTWLIDDGKLQLTVKSSLGKTIYLFNGRVFYVCSALSQAQIDYVKKFTVDDKTLMEKFRQGACQTVPANFMARFFLSPANAVDSIDQTEGLRVTVQVSDHTVKAIESKKECSQQRRTYKLTKTDEIGQVTQQVEETLCINSAIDWRKRLWREVAKTVLRQEGGGQLKATLQSDLKAIGGMIKEQNTSVTMIRGKSKATYQFALKTKSVSEVASSKSSFQIPKGFKIIHPDSLSGIVKPNVATEQKEGKDESPSWIMLCAFSGSFFCLGN